MLNMEQKSYIKYNYEIKYEIINALVSDKSHIRGIAKKLRINHMTVNRKIKELENENIIDYKEEGKNKVYFLKSSIEARSYIMIAEIYRLNKALWIYPVLRGIIEKIQNDKRIGLALLFGSYAKWNAKKDSDIDIYIETNDKNIKKDIELVNSKASIKIGKYDKSNLLIKEIEKNHVIIKGVEDYYEKKFFEKA